MIRPGQHVVEMENISSLTWRIGESVGGEFKSTAGRLGKYWLTKTLSDQILDFLSILSEILRKNARHVQNPQQQQRPTQPLHHCPAYKGNATPSTAKRLASSPHQQANNWISHPPPPPPKQLPRRCPRNMTSAGLLYHLNSETAAMMLCP